MKKNWAEFTVIDSEKIITKVNVVMGRAVSHPMREEILESEAVKFNDKTDTQKAILNEDLTVSIEENTLDGEFYLKTNGSKVVNILEKDKDLYTTVAIELNEGDEVHYDGEEWVYDVKGAITYEAEELPKRKDFILKHLETLHTCTIKLLGIPMSLFGGSATASTNLTANTPTHALFQFFQDRTTEGDEYFFYFLQDSSKIIGNISLEYTKDMFGMFSQYRRLRFIFESHINTLVKNATTLSELEDINFEEITQIAGIDFLPQPFIFEIIYVDGMTINNA